MAPECPVAECCAAGTVAARALPNSSAPNGWDAGCQTGGTGLKPTNQTKCLCLNTIHSGLGGSAPCCFSGRDVGRGGFQRRLFRRAVGGFQFRRGFDFHISDCAFFLLQRAIQPGSPELVIWGSALQATALSNLSRRQCDFRQPGFYRYVIQKAVNLNVPQGTAFEILGHSCGGIKETVSAGLDVSNGYPTGVVTLSTSCGGSGRDGGGHSTTYTASAVVVWDFTGTAISVIPMTNGVGVDPTTPNDGLGDVVYSWGTGTYLAVPVAGPPTDETALQAGDQFNVSWTANIGNPAAIISSQLTATPSDTNDSVLTATVTGNGTSGVIPTLQPATTYQITVVSTTISGSSEPSAPVTVTTSPATILPGVPPGLTASWSNLDPQGNSDTLIASWQPADPGNSPIDQYLVTITSDAPSTETQTVSGTTLTAYFGVDPTPNWKVTVQAHNAAGWGPVSPAVRLGGL